MSKFEAQIYTCLNPVARLLERTTNPLHVAILENFRRHVHLEGAGMFDEIIASDMMVDNPTYRVTWGSNPTVIEGKEAVVGFYNIAAKSVLWHSDDLLAVADWGISDELTFHQLIQGQGLIDLGFEVDHPDKIYHYTSRQVFLWPYDEHARLKGERLYEDKTTVNIVECDPADIITPERVAEIHRECLEKLEATKPEKYWTLETVKTQLAVNHSAANV
ncbi:hypothetical protein NZD89_15505 [Alicyclobacillus fastidiosus]|uniref:Uncharacterized protein n=1 Tax=Alicyclobacillus fastidiosus TaxID=392011 RepID=A0ABY6ZAM6_9BACL|nr:hypothetical protein [Alicyclobacillus fastidiosus]WAH39808.1 hypothetical protein NZD89_15505 [Alicyclobacillus fastidiosus]GMA61064.1 hypothetical protein GCM10025859_15040 [Alicyclobacillus fastidiosus]